MVQQYLHGVVCLQLLGIRVGEDRRARHRGAEKGIAWFSEREEQTDVQSAAERDKSQRRFGSLQTAQTGKTKQSASQESYTCCCSAQADC